MAASRTSRFLPPRPPRPKVRPTFQPPIAGVWLECRSQPSAALASSASAVSGGRSRGSLKRSPGAGFRLVFGGLGNVSRLARGGWRKSAPGGPALRRRAPAQATTSHLDPSPRGRAWGGGPLKTSASTGASVTVPDTSATGAFERTARPGAWPFRVRAHGRRVRSQQLFRPPAGGGSRGLGLA